jgi:hypothetical protein
MNLCKQCVYARLFIGPPDEMLCSHPSAIDPVWGHTYSPCSKERAGISELSCGPSGQHFEAKDA